MTKKPHGIMFHHFFDQKHPKGQGAISSTQFSEIIQFLGRKNILSAPDWMERVKSNQLKKTDLCLTFDDALLCQYEIALPVLNKFNIKAFWFVYSSVLNDGIEMLEIYRKFRTVYFKNIDLFYREFFKFIKKSEFQNTVSSSLNKFNSKTYLSKFPFYSQNDKQFRYVRDQILGPEIYNTIMSQMLKEFKVNIKEFSKDLWMKKNHLKKLAAEGHIVGLHSHTHPTMLVKLSPKEQKLEYKTNLKILKDLLGKKPESMSHPCNSYDKITLKILNHLGIVVGFQSNMNSEGFSNLEIPREDHANILTKMKK